MVRSETPVVYERYYDAFPGTSLREAELDAYYKGVPAVDHFDVIPQISPLPLVHTPHTPHTPRTPESHAHTADTPTRVSARIPQEVLNRAHKTYTPEENAIFEARLDPAEYARNLDEAERELLRLEQERRNKPLTRSVSIEDLAEKMTVEKKALAEKMTAEKKTVDMQRILWETEQETHDREYRKMRSAQRHKVQKRREQEQAERMAPIKDMLAKLPKPTPPRDYYTHLSAGGYVRQLSEKEPEFDAYRLPEEDEED